MKIGTTKPKMTEARALLLASLNNYMAPGYRLTLLEIQKIAYFLQEAGEPLKLDFEKNKYGPYAENLNFVLQRLEIGRASCSVAVKISIFEDSLNIDVFYNT